MNDFMSNLTKVCNRLTKRSGHVFGGPHHRSIIENSRYYGHAFKYVYRNPVKAKLCELVEEYQYSTIHGLLGQSPLTFPIFHARSEIAISIPGLEPYDLIPWLNKPFPKEAEALIQAGLRRKTFGKMICPKKRKEYQELRYLI
jgi:hypothetical protein